jgi:hypothetical protein
MGVVAFVRVEPVTVAVDVLLSVAVTVGAGVVSSERCFGPQAVAVIVSRSRGARRIEGPPSGGEAASTLYLMDQALPVLSRGDGPMRLML